MQCLAKSLLSNKTWCMSWNSFLLVCFFVFVFCFYILLLGQTLSEEQGFSDFQSKVQKKGPAFLCVPRKTQSLSLTKTCLFRIIIGKRNLFFRCPLRVSDKTGTRGTYRWVLFNPNSLYPNSQPIQNNCRGSENLQSLIYVFNVTLNLNLVQLN